MQGQYYDIKFRPLFHSLKVPETCFRERFRDIKVSVLRPETLQNGLSRFNFPRIFKTTTYKEIWYNKQL